MDYLVEFIITIPDDARPAEIEQRLAGETTRVAELAAQGHVLRVWKPLPDDGRRRALGLYRAASDEQLEAILDSLPLRPWMEISVTALAEHPNDPARSTVSRADATGPPRCSSRELTPSTYERTHDERTPRPGAAPRLPAGRRARRTHRPR
jgi:muconolactone D-isomerase